MFPLNEPLSGITIQKFVMLDNDSLRGNVALDEKSEYNQYAVYNYYILLSHESIKSLLRIYRIILLHIAVPKL